VSFFPGADRFGTVEFFSFLVMVVCGSLFLIVRRRPVVDAREDVGHFSARLAPLYFGLWRVRGSGAVGCEVWQMRGWGLRPRPGQD